MSSTPNTTKKGKAAPASTTAIAKQTPATEPAAPQIKGPRRASEILAEHLGLDPGRMIEVIKAQCFPGARNPVSNEQLAAYINVANSLTRQAPNFNPLLPGMLYAFPTQNGGIQPMIGPDGVYALLGSRSDVEGWESSSEFDDAGKVFSASATIWITGKRPFKKTVYLSEWQTKNNDGRIKDIWKRESHQLEWQALKQAARMVIHGLPAGQKAEHIIEAEYAEMVPAERPAIATETRSATVARRIAAAPVEAEKPADNPAQSEAAGEEIDASYEATPDPPPMFDDREKHGENGEFLPESEQ